MKDINNCAYQITLLQATQAIVRNKLDSRMEGVWEWRQFILN